MPDTPSQNGLTTFSLHTMDESTAAVAEDLLAEPRAHAGLRADGDGEAMTDPETAARRFLDRALASDTVPAFTAPTVDDTTSGFATINTETVPLTHTRVVKFRQTLNDIPVYGSLVSIELDEDNKLLSIDSSLGEPQDVDPIASVSPKGALDAVAAAPAGYTPRLTGVVPRLYYYYDRGTGRWRLVYVLQDVPVSRDADASGSGPEPPHIVDYVVDAHDASVVALLPRTPSVASEQTAVDSFNEKRTFTVSTDGGHLVMVDPEHNVKTFDFDFNDPEVNGSKLPGDVITNPPSWSPAAVSAHANAIAVSDFLRTVMLRDNIDDRGGPMVSSINCVVKRDSRRPKEWVNAFWNTEQMVYGQVLRPEGLRSLAANLDVVGHEMFHGVTDYTSRLEYQLQSGAMNESYSDIFGTVIANRGNDDPRTWDWQIGENLLPGNKPLRDMSNPRRFGQPDHMDDFQNLPNTEQDDFGGVHANSGIHNKAAFNVFTAEDDDGALVLRPEEAAAVFYLALTQRLTRTSQFADGRQAVLSSARTLFRTQPTDDRNRKIAAIGAAYDAVGIH
jgi:Zn-dependent metalloprotease